MRKIKCKSCGNIDNEKKWVTVLSGMRKIIKLDADRKKYLPCPSCKKDVQFEIIDGDNNDTT